MSTDIGSWLRALGLEQYAQAFADNHIDADLLGDLDDEDLKALGIASLGHRKRLLRAIAERAAPRQEPSQAPPPASIAAQRRQVTVLFADLCGFTDLSRQIDPEELRRLVQRFYALADAAIVDFGGSVDKHLGDGVMALFGAPIAHGDDSLHALSAADALHRCAELLTAEFEPTLGRPVELHIGVAAGEVVAGGLGSAYTVLGDAVNLAARLVSAAAPGQTVASDAVRRAAGYRAEFEDLGRQRIKGVGEDVPIWRLTAVRPASRGGAAPYIGRSSERSLLEAIIDAAARREGGRFLLLRGDPGIGKTRTVAEIERLALARGFVIHAARALEFGAGRLGDPLRQLLRSLAGPAAEAADKGGEEAAALLPPDAPPLWRAALCEGLGLPMSRHAETAWQAAAETTRLAARHALLSSLAGSAAERMPALLVLEDLHWATSDALAGLGQLARLTADRRLVVTATTRLDGDPLERGLREAVGDAPVTLIDLQPLQPDDAVTLAAGLGPLDANLLRACVERAGGNPLFLEQLVRNASEAASELLPGSLRSLIAARVDRLPVETQEALHAASVLGQRFDGGALAFVIGAFESRLQAALESGLMRGEGAMLTFTHALIQEGVYLSVLRDRRKALHRRAADWFRERDPVLHAEHLERAEDPEAAAAYLAAAHAEQKAYRAKSAAQLAQRGLVLTADGRLRGRLLTARAEALLDAGQAHAAQDAFALALASVETPGERCAALLGLAGARRIFDDLDGAMEALAEAERIAEAAALTIVLSKVHHMRGNILFPRGRSAECVAAQERALAFAEQAGSAEAVAVALGGLGDAEYARGRMLSASRYFERCVQAAREAGLGRTEVANRPMAALCRYMLMDPEGMVAAGGEAIALAREVGQPRAELIGLHAQIMGYTIMNAPREAIALVDRAQEIVHALNAFRFEPENLAFLAEALFAMGERAAAQEQIARALEKLSDTATLTFVGPVALAIAAQVETDPERADAYLARAEPVLAAGSLAHNHLWLRRYGMEIGWARRSVEMIERHRAALADCYAAEPSPMTDFLIERGRLLADRLRGARDAEWRNRLDALRALARERRLALLDRAMTEAAAETESAAPATS